MDEYGGRRLVIYDKPESDNRRQRTALTVF
jgi:hypothetical protein